MNKIGIVVLVLLFMTMLGLAYHIEVNARPVKDVKVEVQHGEGSHGH